MTALAATAGSETALPRVVSPLRDSDLVEWKQRETNARNDRRRFEPVWQLCQSFLQNRQWVGWDYNERRIVEMPNPDDRVRITVNVLTQYVWTFLGKLTQDDFRADIKFRRDDPISRAYARQTQAAFNYGWDEEWEGDPVILEALLSMASFGLGGILVRPDPTYGQVVGEYPIDEQGKLHIVDQEKFAADRYASGEGFDLHQLRQGRLAWDPFNPFNFLPPPGVHHERDFPWMIFERPVAIPHLKLLYGDKAANVREESMRAIDMIGVREDNDIASGGAASGMLKDHARLLTGFEFATRENPEGRKVVWAGDVKLEDKPLPLQINGCGKAGAVFFKYHPVPGRWWPIGVVEPGIGPQKQRNRARSQWIEMKDRAGLGRVFAYKGTVTSVNKPKGGVFELVEVLPGHDFPKETQGVAPGEWLQAEVAQNDSDLDRVMGLREVSLGQAPAGVSAYSAFALLAEQDDRRVGPVLKLIRWEVAKLTKLTVAGMRQYWLPGKQVMLTGDDPDGLLDSFLYDSTKIPQDFLVEVGKGAPLPQSQAAEAQLIFDVFDRGISSGQVQPIDWLVDSLKQHKMQPLPQKEPLQQLNSADLENTLMAHGTPVQVQPYDNDELHVQRHRMVQQALHFAPGMEQIVALVEQHIQEHLQSAMMKQAQAAPGQAPGGNGGQTNPGGFGAQGAADQAGVGPAGKAQPAAAVFANRHSALPPNVRAG